MPQVQSYHDPARHQSPPGSNVTQSVAITNYLPFPVAMFVVSNTGELLGSTMTSFAPGYPGYIFPAAGGPQVTQPFLSSFPGGAYLAFFTVATGGLAILYQLPFTATAAVAVNLTQALFCKPNDLGQVPQPGQNTIIPPDSQRIVVGCGTPTAQGYVLREQYWRRLPDSYTIAKGQNRTVSFTVVEGIQSISSNLETVSASLGLSAQGGWGPVSASVSSSLSVSSTRYQQLTLSTETTSFVSDTLAGPTSGPDIAMYIYWQLMDVISVVNATNTVLASVVTGQKPIIVAGPYDPSGPRVSVKPHSVTLTPSLSQTFTAEIDGAQDLLVHWSVTPATGAGTILPTGVYTSPSTISAPAAATVTATSIVDGTKIGTARVTLAPQAAEVEGAEATTWTPPVLTPAATAARDQLRDALRRT